MSSDAPGSVEALTAAQATPAASADPLPLCFDLDGSLLNTDTLLEALVGALRNWRTAIRLPILFASGKAGLKAGLSELGVVDPTLLPYNHAALAYLREQKANGRPLILATAANRRLAEGVNHHLDDMFDEVIASDANRNLRGAAKARALVDRFGERGFSYAGNDRTDLHVWRHAGGAVLVNASRSVARRAEQLAPVEKILPSSNNLLVSLIKEFRLYQWSKNLLVFVPILASGAIFDVQTWLAAFLTFFSFCFVASSLYVFNDLCDLDADRRHARKRQRPFASGALPLMSGILVPPALFLLGMALGFWADVLLYVAGYAAVSIAYSVKLKELQLVDVFVLAALYSIRLFAGGEATGHEISLWLLAFSGFIFLGLAIMKRVAELQFMIDTNEANSGRRGYLKTDITVLQAFSVGAAFVSCLILALYIQSNDVALVYSQPKMLWWIVPLTLFWQCRLLLATSRGYMDDDPIVYAAKDKVTALVAVGIVLCFIFAL